MSTPPSSHEARSRLLRKSAALFEVLGVLIVGNFAAGKLQTLLRVEPLGSLFQPASNTSQPDFVAFTAGWLKVICLQYACLLPPAFAIGWWRRRFGLAHYGVTTAGQPVWRLVALGLIAFALVCMPFKLLWIANRFLALGPGSAYWALLDTSWTPSFWLFLAVSSFAVTPVLEELFYRGYCQTRLEEDFGGIGAMVIVALFMTLGHNQYHQLNMLSIGMILSLIPLALGLGYVYWRTRSLVPAMILHAAANFPTKGIYDFVLPAVMVAVLILFRTKWMNMVQDFHQEWLGKTWKRAAFVATVVAVVLVVGFESWPGLFIPLGFLGLAAALWIEYRDRRLGS